MIKNKNKKNEKKQQQADGRSFFPSIKYSIFNNEFFFSSGGLEVEFSLNRTENSLADERE